MYFKILTLIDNDHNFVNKVIDRLRGWLKSTTHTSKIIETEHVALMYTYTHDM